MHSVESALNRLAVFDETLTIMFPRLALGLCFSVGLIRLAAVPAIIQSATLEKWPYLAILRQCNGEPCILDHDRNLCSQTSRRC